MKTLRFVLLVVLMSLSTVAFAQSDAHKSADKPKPSGAQISFDTIKTLAGNWVGAVTTEPPIPEMGNGARTQVSMRVTSRGNALVHEMFEAGKADDPTRYDHPLTMLYVDGDRLTLIHYCDAGNRPRMVARNTPDGKKVEFDFVDLSGGNEHGHMYHAVFSIIDANHHIEDWTYIMPGDKPLHARIDLQRIKDAAGVSGK
jgi:hypothetical protein